jgi:hypothetical protein
VRIQLGTSRAKGLLYTFLADEVGAHETHGSLAMRDSKGKSHKQPTPLDANRPKSKGEVRLLLKLQMESLKAHGERLDPKKAPTTLNSAK